MYLSLWRAYEKVLPFKQRTLAGLVVLQCGPGSHFYNNVTTCGPGHLQMWSELSGFNTFRVLDGDLLVTPGCSNLPCKQVREHLQVITRVIL